MAGDMVLDLTRPEDPIWLTCSMVGCDRPAGWPVLATGTDERQRTILVELLLCARHGFAVAAVGLGGGDDDVVA